MPKIPTEPRKPDPIDRWATKELSDLPGEARQELVTELRCWRFARNAADSSPERLKDHRRACERFLAAAQHMWDLGVLEVRWIMRSHEELFGYIVTLVEDAERLLTTKAGPATNSKTANAEQRASLYAHHCYRSIVDLLEKHGIGEPAADRIARRGLKIVRHDDAAFRSDAQDELAFIAMLGRPGRPAVPDKHENRRAVCDVVRRAMEQESDPRNAACVITSDLGLTGKAVVYKIADWTRDARASKGLQARMRTARVAREILAAFYDDKIKADSLRKLIPR